VSLLAATAATGRSQAAPSNTKEPSITYVHPIKVGTVLTGNRGSWTGADRFTYQWLRCNDNGEGCKHISNATDTTYTVANADQGHTIRLDVTAKNADGNTTARANATGQVPKNPNAPVEVTAPDINGDAVVGETLTATTGTWKGNQPISYTFKWQTCNAAMTSCPANGETGNTYTVRAADVGLRVRVKVIAKNNAGQTAGLSAPTGPVKQSGGGGGGVNVSSLKAFLAEPGQFEELADPRFDLGHRPEGQCRQGRVRLDGLDACRDVVADTGADGLERHRRVHDPPGIGLPDQERLQRAVLRQGVPAG
jgi:hypothetical protein